MAEDERGQDREASEGLRYFYPGLIREFIEVQGFHEGHRAFPAFEDALIHEGVVRTGSKLLAFVSKRKPRPLGERERRLGGSPYLWFYIEQGDEFESFVVDFSMALEAIEKAEPIWDGIRVPVPAYLADEPDDDFIRVGALRHLTLSLVEVEGVPESEFRAPAGVRFEIAEEVDDQVLRPLYSFTMEPLTALLALSSAMFGEGGDEPSPFDRELDEFEAEIDEVATEAADEEIEEEG